MMLNGGTYAPHRLLARAPIRDFTARQIIGDSARALGWDIPLSEEDRKRPYVEVSGRKGLGVKADDLIDMLSEKAREEVGAREMTKDAGEQIAYSRMIAVTMRR